MLPHREISIRLPQEMKVSFSELKIDSHLRASHISKFKGTSCLTIFTIIFLFSFNHQTLFQVNFCGNKSFDLPGKDLIYRFLNQSTYNGRKFLLSLSFHAVRLCQRLMPKDRVKVLIVDDSTVERNHSYLWLPMGD